jgi:hypothetical protein
LLLTALQIAGCADEPTVATVEGPEAADFVKRLKGYIVTNDTGELTAVSLPDRRTHVVRRLVWNAEGTGPTIHSVSGPDRVGRVAYVEDYYFVKTEKEQRHLLKTVHIDGTNDSEVFSRPGSAMWATNGEIGSYLALAPTAGRVAFISQVVSRQMPGALLSLGHIEIWRLDEKAGSDSGIIALDEPMSWFPDGERLAYSTLVARKDLPPHVGGLKEFGNYFGNSWDDIPAIYIYDVKSKENTLFHVCWQPVVSHDGQTVLVGGWGAEDFGWYRVDVATRKSTPLKLPGAVGNVIGTAPDDGILYVGLPTAGSPIRFTENNSALRGPKQMLTVKIADKEGKRFQTIIPFIDPRSVASFGTTN